MVVVQLQIAHQCCLQIGPAVEASLLQQLVDAAVELLDHAVHLRMARRRQTVLGRQCGARHVEGVLATWLLVFGGETVGKLRAVVSEYLANLDGRGQLQAAQEIDATLVGHLTVNYMKAELHKIRTWITS